MACLPVTTEQLEEEFVAVFGDGKGVPSKLWIDHFHSHHTFIRAVYPEEFTGEAADRLMDLRRRLLGRYGFKSAELSVVVFLHDESWEFFAAHRLHIHLV